MRVTDKHIFFWGDFPSNWHKCHFIAEVEGKKLEFFNSEQYFMWKKAKFFNDEDIALRILLEGKNPKTAKALGRLVKNYDDAAWDKVRYDIMVEANMLKYGQNKDLKKQLLSKEFEGKRYVEASPLDKIFGVGLHEDDPLINDEKNWKGRNLLGKALDEVRNRLKNGNK